MLNVTGDNGSYSGKLSFTYPIAGSVGLYYNGNSSDPNVASTNITITQEDLAWYRSGSADMFQVTSQGGGQSFGIEVDWLVNPGIGASPNVSPTSVVADGSPVTFTISLVKPLPPLQNGTTCVLTFDSYFGSAVVTATPVMGGAGNAWITGWTAIATTVAAGTSSTSTLGITIKGNITYLSGSGTFTTETMTYYNSSLSIAVAAYIAPTKRVVSIPSLSYSFTFPVGQSPTISVIISGGGGSGATANASTSSSGNQSGVTLSIWHTSLVSSGSGYTSAPSEFLIVNGTTVASGVCTIG
jgi:hypothetical protein